MDPTHKGPILYYLAKSSDGSGAVWFKIYEDGYDASSGQWATDKMIANRGLMTITLPSDIAPGNYLLRGEIFALHNAYVIDGVQPYVGCVELTISGSGSATPAGVSIPGVYSDTDAGLNVDVYQPIAVPYPIPGPALYVSGSAPSSSSGSASTPTDAPSNPTDAPANPTDAPANPTDAPANPTDAPANPTDAPANPTDAPSRPSGGSLQVAVHGGSSTWWLGVDVSGGSESTTNVEITDSGSVSWTALQQMPYAWVYSRSVELTLPISVRLTSASGKQVTYNDILTQWDQSTPSGSSDYSSGSAATNPASSSGSAAVRPTVPPSNPTSAPSNPTSAPSNPTSAPSSPSSAGGSSVEVTLHPNANDWWFALSLNDQAGSVASVEVKDSDAVTSYAFMTYASWGYSLSAQGKPFVAPLTVRITNEAGQSVTATIPSITPGAKATAQ
jgi:expansin (peptidoglycan-binding protein)